LDNFWWGGGRWLNDSGFDDRCRFNDRWHDGSGGTHGRSYRGGLGNG
jgi:hypothetical protein